MSNNTLYLKPAPGLIVLDPVTGKALDADGEAKPDTTYWRRRLRDMDVTVAAAAEAAPTKGGKSK